MRLLLQVSLVLASLRVSWGQCDDVAIEIAIVSKTMSLSSVSMARVNLRQNDVINPASS